MGAGWDIQPERCPFIQAGRRRWQAWKHPGVGRQGCWVLLPDTAAQAFLFSHSRVCRLLCGPYRTMTHTCPAARHSVNPCIQVPSAPANRGKPLGIHPGQGTSSNDSLQNCPPRIAPYLLGHPGAPTTPLLLLVSFKNESLWLSHLDSRGDQRDGGGRQGVLW